MVDTDSEDQCCAGGQLSVCLRDCVSRAFHCFIQLTRRIVPPLCVDLAQVIADVDTPAEDVAEISVLNAPAKISLEDDLGEHCIQTNLIAAVRRRSKTDELVRCEVVEDLPVSICCGVVCLVADN